MRDRRFIAEHRGGPLDREKHRMLAAWAADVAEGVLPLFESECAGDGRVRHAIEVGKAWSRGESEVRDAMKASLGAHAAARSAKGKAAIAAARAAGQAVATAHSADHSLAAPLYALRALEAAGRPTDAERAWQLAHLPEPVRELVVSATKLRFAKRPKRAAPLKRSTRSRAI